MDKPLRTVQLSGVYRKDGLAMYRDEYPSGRFEYRWGCPVSAAMEKRLRNAWERAKERRG